jgi:hypothetical protein
MTIGSMAIEDCSQCSRRLSSSAARTPTCAPPGFRHLQRVFKRCAVIGMLPHRLSSRGCFPREGSSDSRIESPRTCLRPRSQQQASSRGPHSPGSVLSAFRSMTCPKRCWGTILGNGAPSREWPYIRARQRYREGSSVATAAPRWIGQA